jgi:hypothetical protein
VRRLAGGAGAVVAALSAACLALMALAGPVGADTAPEQGWWTTLTLGNGVNAAGTGVPANDLLVESEVNSKPEAYSALLFQLPDGDVPSTLTLNVAPAPAATTPDATLEICPLKSPVFTAAAGGPSSAAPAYDCTTNVTAAPESSGSAYQFKVSGFESNGMLAIAILPTSATDRVVFSAPSDSSLSVSQPTSTTTPTTSLVTPTTLPAASPLPVSSTATTFPGFSGNSGSGTSSSFVPTGGSGQTPSTPTTTPATSPVAQSAAPAPSPSTSLPLSSFATVTDNASAPVVALVLIGLFGGAALWAYAGRRRPEEELVT